jgi:hypothetical protein
MSSAFPISTPSGDIPPSEGRLNGVQSSAKLCAARHIMTFPGFRYKVRLSSGNEGHFSCQIQLSLERKDLPSRRPVHRAFDTCSDDHENWMRAQRSAALISGAALRAKRLRDYLDRQSVDIGSPIGVSVIGCSFPLLGIGRR